jgi:hypothetical protein
MLDLSGSHPGTACERLAVMNVTRLASMQDIANKRVFHGLGGTFAVSNCNSMHILPYFFPPAFANALISNG